MYLIILNLLSLIEFTDPFTNSDFEYSATFSNGSNYGYSTLI